jgi:hypothetical protein
MTISRRITWAGYVAYIRKIKIHKKYQSEKLKVRLLERWRLVLRRTLQRE